MHISSQNRIKISLDSCNGGPFISIPCWTSNAGQLWDFNAGSTSVRAESRVIQNFISQSLTWGSGDGNGSGFFFCQSPNVWLREVIIENGVCNSSFAPMRFSTALREEISFKGRT